MLSHLAAQASATLTGSQHKATCCALMGILTPQYKLKHVPAQSKQHMPAQSIYCTTAQSSYYRPAQLSYCTPAQSSYHTPAQVTICYIHVGW